VLVLDAVVADCALLLSLSSSCPSDQALFVDALDAARVLAGFFSVRGAD